MQVIRFDTIDSTNAEAKRRFRAGTADFGTLFITNEQTAGRGRLGRSFYSPKDRGVYFSLIIQPSEAELVTVRAALAACRAIEEICGIHCGIKWINDIYYGGKKIAGILAEGISEGSELKAQVLGIGINLRGGDFPEIIKDRAGSLETDADGEALAVKTAEIFLSLSKGASLSKEGLAEYKSRQIILGSEIEIFKMPCGGSGVGLDEEGNKINGIRAKAIDIDEKGRLIVEYSGKAEALSSGEVSIKI